MTGLNACSHPSLRWPHAGPMLATCCVFTCNFTCFLVDAPHFHSSRSLQGHCKSSCFFYTKTATMSCYQQIFKLQVINAVFQRHAALVLEEQAHKCYVPENKHLTLVIKPNKIKISDRFSFSFIQNIDHNTLQPLKKVLQHKPIKKYQLIKLHVMQDVSPSTNTTLQLSLQAKNNSTRTHQSMWSIVYTFMQTHTQSLCQHVRRAPLFIYLFFASLSGGYLWL